MSRVCSWAVLLLLVPGCAGDPPQALGAGVGPRPQAPGGDCGGAAAMCDAIPPAAAMPDAQPAMAPPAWHDYCRRHREDTACSG